MTINIEKAKPHINTINFGIMVLYRIYSTKYTFLHSSVEGLILNKVGTDTGQTSNI